MFLAVLVGVAAFNDEIPHWRADGADVILHDPLAPVGSFPIQIARGASVVFMGDSNTKGRFPRGDGDPFPEALGNTLGNSLTVLNLGSGGAVTPYDGAAGVARVSAGDLIVLAYGTNDAAPREWLSAKKQVPLATYQTRLESLATHYREQGTIVLILAPLPAGTTAMERRIAPYRNAARQAAVNAGCRFLDPAGALANAMPDRPPLQRDALHLNARGSLQVGKWLAGKLRLE